MNVKLALTAGAVATLMTIPLAAWALQPTPSDRPVVCDAEHQQWMQEHWDEMDSHMAEYGDGVGHGMTGMMSGENHPQGLGGMGHWPGP